MYSDVMKIMDEITWEFENQIKPKIFSIELFWREIYAFMKFKPQSKIETIKVEDILVNLKSKEIMNNQPF